MAWSIGVCFSILILHITLTSVTSLDSFTAAVYEHNVTYPRNRTVVDKEDAVYDMIHSLVAYETQTKRAVKQNASMIVFPEYGLYGLGWTRETIVPYLEYIPDPEVTSWNPCDHPRRRVIQGCLSCLAKANKIFVVANMGARQPCNKSDPRCPKDGAYHFSTNVVYNTTGHFVARYFKYNLNTEETAYFDKPEKVNITTFETPFGKFGTFTSSDILYKEPAMTLIQKMNITNIAYPTAWKEELPLMSAIEFHSAFAEGLSINLLAANLHIPDLGYYGSGLYWPTGTSIDAAYVYADTSSKGQLVVGKVAPFIPTSSDKRHTNSQIPLSIRGDIKDPTSTRENTSIEEIRFISSKTNNLPHKEYKLTINGDVYTAIILQRIEDYYEPKVCQGEICCGAGIEGMFPKGDVFAFGAFDGYHGSGDQRYYLQACIFVKCANDSHESCGLPTKYSNSYVDKMSFVGNFTSPGVVYPEVLTNDNGELELNTRAWLYQESIIIDVGVNGGPIAIAMLNRVYSRDCANRTP